MTAKKDLKKKVRSRQLQTGERYTAALERVKQSRARPRVPILELPDLSAIAASAGLKCSAYCSLPFRDLRQDDQEQASLARSVLDRLVEVLRVTETDPSTALLRRALLHDKAPPPDAFRLWRAGRLRSFTQRLQLGVRGISEDGGAIAFETPDPSGGAPLTLVAMLWPSRRRGSVLYLSLSSEWLNAKSFLDGLATVFGPIRLQTKAGAR